MKQKIKVGKANRKFSWYCEACGVKCKNLIRIDIGKYLSCVVCPSCERTLCEELYENLLYIEEN